MPLLGLRVDLYTTHDFTPYLAFAITSFIKYYKTNDLIHCKHDISILPVLIGRVGIGFEPMQRPTILLDSKPLLITATPTIFVEP